MYVNWGDGKHSHRTFTDEGPGTYLIASHTYGGVAHTTTYTETVTGSVVSGSCGALPATIFKFTHLVHVQQPWWVEWQITEACAHDLLPSPVDLVLNQAVAMVLVRVPGWGPYLAAAYEFASGSYAVFKLVRDCVQKSDPVVPARLLHALSYGFAHRGKLFKPSGKVPQPPQITGIYGYQSGSLVYFSLTYANPDHDAKGFGFVGINGAGWAEENHSFSSPSYGIVGHDRIAYPFNLACGTAQHYNSWVDAWIYDSQGIRSKPAEIALTCTT